MAQRTKGSPKRRPERPLVVYSTDPPKPVLCTGCRRPKSDCVCKPVIPSGLIKPVVRIERKARGGKTVTVIEKLPAVDSFLRELCSHLKRRVGGGGTHYLLEGSGVVELQGDHREQVLELVKQFLHSRE